MLTWNFQYISKKRLAIAFDQLMLRPENGDILVRIHTAIHTESEAVELAKFISALVPGAHIFGTSTSAVINGGKLLPDQCVISVTQMSKGTVRTALLPAFDDEERPIPPDVLCRNVKEAVIADDSKLVLTFLTGKYLDVYSFVEKCNKYFPGVQMTGGIANTSEMNLRKSVASGFVFNEKGYTSSGLIAASISGKAVDSYTSCATGVQVLGGENEITDTFGTCILSLDGKDAAAEFVSGAGAELIKNPELTVLFPYVYSDTPDIPVFVHYSADKSIAEMFDKESPINAVSYGIHQDLDVNEKRPMIYVNHNVTVGKKLRRAFIYDRKIIADNHALFRHVENFEKAETIFAYSCMARSLIYSSCVKWELSAYANSNICGCITDGEIACVNGKNTFANCSFVVSVFGEEPASQDYNPYAFSYTDALVADNQELLNYLYAIEDSITHSDRAEIADSLKAFVHDCEMKLLYSENEDIPNAAALNMDIQLRGYDRVCMINVFDLTSIETVFPERMINLTYKNYVFTCMTYAKKKKYNIYCIDKWHLAIAAPSYMVSLAEFASDMETLQKQLFEVSAEYIAIVPMFCVIDDCSADNIKSVYYSARVEMMQKNIQFYIRDAKYGMLDEKSILDQYHMVNVINYALAHDRVVPYYQGIHDNNSNKIHHYESLMRLEDESGKVYYPGSFLDVARSYGLLYDSLSKVMIQKVFERFRHLEGLSVSLNLSIRDIKNREITEYIFEFLSTADHPENFVFEILENEDIDNYDELVAFVDRIHFLGGKISIDDFGSGYSNLMHIANIHSDFLKIDGSIIRNACTDEQSANLISLIMYWKKISNMQFKIVAEFVENEEIQNMLTKYGIDYSQGYFFSKPVPDLITLD